MIMLVRAQEQSSLQLTTHKPLPALQLLSLGGDKATVDFSKHALTAVHFWATWCVPCVEELPKLNEAQKRYRERGFHVVAISMDGKNSSKVKKFLSEQRITGLETVLDNGMKSYKAAMVIGLPTTLFIDRQGRQIARSDGDLDWQSPEITEFIEQQLAAASPK